MQRQRLDDVAAANKIGQSPAIILALPVALVLIKLPYVSALKQHHEAPLQLHVSTLTARQYPYLEPPP